MSKHLQKAMLLFERRPEMAAKELLAALVEEPDDSYIHALLGLCLMNMNDKEGAFSQVKEAIRLDPTHAFAFYSLAKCHFDAINMLDAEVAIDEALRLEPWNTTYWGLLSNIQIEQGELKEALKSAENGLERTPEDVHCHNLRALIKTKLGQKKEAKQSLDTALAAAPEDALTHAYRGWALIEHHNHAESIAHFREALRLDPTMEWARQGLIKALQVRHWVFQLQLRLKEGPALAVVGIVTVALVCLVTFTGNSHGAASLFNTLKIVCAVFIVAYIVCLITPAVFEPLMRVLLIFDRDGRLVLTREERFFNSHLVAFVSVALISIAGASYFSAWWTLPAIVALYFLTMPLTLAHEKRNKKLWLTMGAASLLFGGIAVLAANHQMGAGSLRIGFAYVLAKSLMTAGGAKAILGAIGLGAAATAMKAKEKEKIREQMLNQQKTSNKKTK